MISRSSKGTDRTLTTRRGVMTGLAALGAGAMVPAAALTAAAAPAKAPIRIDVHHHFVPPEYVQRGGSIPPLKSWTVDRSLDDMSKGGVTTAMLSITTPVLQVLAADGKMMSRDLIRRCNDFGARLVADHPGRFGFFAALPLTDVEGSLQEIDYAFDTLKADGIGLFTSYGNQWLGNPAFDPVFTELNRRKAVIYTHPVSPTCCTGLIPQVNDSEIEYGTDTSRALASMVFTGASQRFPDIRLVFSHGGGTVPYLIRRFIKDAKGVPALAKLLPNGFMPEAHRFYYDIAQLPIRPPLLALKEVVPVSHLVFGTDYPYLTAAEHVEGLKEARVFTARELRAIDQNVAALVPRLRA
jgi:predicted TIM-barrel fold metal-dependent hydrolase